MPRSLDVLVESPVSISELHAAFSGTDYWLDRLAAFGKPSTLDSLVLDADESVRVVITQDLRHEVLPGILAKYYRRDLEIVHTEVWRRARDGDLHGEISLAVSGAPGSGSGVAVVTPTQGGSRLTLTGTVEFKVPIVGGKIESYIAREFALGIPDIQRFTTDWIGDHV